MPELLPLDLSKETKVSSLPASFAFKVFFFKGLPGEFEGFVFLPLALGLLG